MPIEAIVFFAGAIGIIAFTAAITWINAYAKGYHDGVQYCISRLDAHGPPSH